MKHVHVLMITLICAVLAGCAGAPSQPPHTHYGLSADMSQPVRYGAEGLVLVERVQAEGVIAGRPILKKTGDQPLQLREMEGHLWRAAPSALVQEAVVKSLSDASQDLSFLPAGIGVTNGDFVLRVALTGFHWDAGAQTAEIAVYATVTRRKGNALILTKTYRKTASTGTSAGSGISGLGAALGLVLDDLAKDLASAL